MGVRVRGQAVAWTVHACRVGQGMLTWLCLYPPDMTVSRVIEPSSVPRWYASSWVGERRRVEDG